MFGRRGASKSICLIVLSIFYIYILHNEANALVRFTNCKCETLDSEYCTFPYCFLKAINRSYQYFSMRVDMHELPIQKPSFRWTLWKKANGYRPFLYNITMDACKYMRNPKVNKVAEFILDLFRDYSNINHSCPYNHDIIVEKLPNFHLNHRLTTILPFPRGDYLFESTWMVYGVEKARVKWYFELS